MIDRLIASNASRSQEREKTRKIEFFIIISGFNTREREKREFRKENSPTFYFPAFGNSCLFAQPSPLLF